MSIEGQGHFFTIYFPGFVCFVLYLAKISGERLQDHWSSGFMMILETILTNLNEVCHEKISFLHTRKTKAQICCMITLQLIRAFAFAT